MRTVVPVCRGGDGGASRGLRSRVDRMKRLLSLRRSLSVDVHTDTEPGVWLTGFQLLDTDVQYQVGRNWTAKPSPVIHFPAFHNFISVFRHSWGASGLFSEIIPVVKMLPKRIIQRRLIPTENTDYCKNQTNKTNICKYNIHTKTLNVAWGSSNCNFSLTSTYKPKDSSLPARNNKEIKKLELFGNLAWNKSKLLESKLVN